MTDQLAKHTTAIGVLKRKVLPRLGTGNQSTRNVKLFTAQHMAFAAIRQLPHLF